MVVLMIVLVAVVVVVAVVALLGGTCIDWPGGVCSR